MFDAQKRTKTVFDNETVLSTTKHVHPIGREEELNEIADRLRPVAQGHEPDDLLVYGPAGSGKTTCVNHVFDRLHNQTRVKTVRLNCWNYTTRSAILAQLLIELGYVVPRRGKPVDELTAKLREWVDKNHDIVVALDEFDQLDEQNEIIYDLHNIGVQADGHLGMVIVANKPPSQLDLEQRSQSRLGYQTVQFMPYDKDDLIDILAERAEDAFKPGCLGDDVVDHVAETVSTEIKRGCGDCRHALEILHRAGREADKEHADKVTIAHVERATNPARH